MWQTGRGGIRPKQQRKQRLNLPPHLLQELPIGSSDTRGVPNSEPGPSKGLQRKRREEAKPQRSMQQPAGLRPPGSSLVGPPFLPPFSPAEPPAGHLSTPALDPACTPSSPPTEDPCLPPPQIGPSRPPCLRPGTPSPRVLPTSESARHPHFPPSTRRLPVRPNFSRPRPGPRSRGDSVSRAATGGRAGSHSLCPCPPSRHELRLGPARRPGLSGQPGAEAEAEPAWREPRCPSARTPARCRVSQPARRSLPTCPRAPAPPTSSRAAAATAGNTWQWPPPLALLASPRLSSRRPCWRLRHAGPQRQAPSAARKSNPLALTLTRRPPPPRPPPPLLLPAPPLARSQFASERGPRSQETRPASPTPGPPPPPGSLP